ncbi:hypothetical protein I6N90_19270 [Paenibacillus sp. GSMTC-2017]|uniref:hypothetical protein n=1 Tax=Paenibacillus sp. GSMTC-2017 TaxID=2794350 RepID=UPI0018D82160|nr:hypothetical protein [Paenibacillus sp. GSMTC-2017]MBH5319944.1 hypothetical protein [Paenibacillus sp. GSMTC-2017]
MNKSLIYLMMVSIFIIIVLVIQTIEKENFNGQVDTPIASMESVTEVEVTPAPEVAVAKPVVGSIEELKGYPKLEVKTSVVDGGFKLAIDDGSLSARSVAEESSYGTIIHLVERDLQALDGTEAIKRRYDVVVVRPDRMEIKVYPAYIVDEINQLVNHKLKLINDKQVVFTQNRIENGLLIYDLVVMNVENGEVNGVVQSFWKVAMDSEEYQEDFLVSAHYAQRDNSQVNKILLTSFLGKTWLFQLDTLAVTHSGSSLYPAYGDKGSKPPRELLFPSPDLERFVYQSVEENQIITKNQFTLVDTLSRKTLNTIHIDDSMTLTDPGIVWNEEGTSFFQEYADASRAQSTYFDNSSVVFAEYISFYNRDGELIRTLKSSSRTGERMSVFGWLDENSLLIETYRSIHNEVGGWIKGTIVYKEYNLRSGKLTTYKSIKDATLLVKPVLVPIHNGFAYDSKSFVVIDRNSKKVWSPDVKGRSFITDGQLYTTVWGGNSELVFRWNDELKQLQLVSDEQEIRLQMISGDWLIRKESRGNNFVYKTTTTDMVRNAEGLPVLPTGAFGWISSSREWWKDTDDSVKTNETSSSRLVGKSRYGKLFLRSAKEEKSSKMDTAYQYYGDYEVEFTNAKGVKRTLQTLEKLELKLESPLESMRVIPYKGFDLLLFQPVDFPFSEVYDRNYNKLYAYAITWEGEAFPLNFQYASTDGMTRLETIPVAELGTHALREGNLIVESSLNEKLLEIEWRLDIEERTFTLTNLRDVSAEAESLYYVTDHYLSLLERALGLDMGDPKVEHMNKEQLRAMFTELAWNSPGFQRMKSAFEESEAAGNPSQAFAQFPVRTSYDKFGNIRVTFAFNLMNGIGMIAYLDAILKIEDNKWMFHDFGTLETEKSDYDISLNGVLIKDNLKH